MSTYIMSDLHGDWGSFYEILIQINFCPSDKLFIIGDLIDRGSDNLLLLNYVRGCKNITLLKGNHELFAQRYLEGALTRSKWSAWGGSTTLEELDTLNEAERNQLLMYLQGLPFYVEVEIGEEIFFLTHSGYDNRFTVYKETDEIDIKASVCKAAKHSLWEYLLSDNIHRMGEYLRLDKKVIVGHTPTIYLRGNNYQASIYHTSRYIDVDTGNGQRQQGGKLSCFRLEDRREYYV